jgi:hypothetical protein
MFVKESIEGETLIDRMQIRYLNLDIEVVIECNQIETVIVDDAVFSIKKDKENNRILEITGGHYEESTEMYIDDFIADILEAKPSKITLHHASGRTDTYTHF